MDVAVIAIAGASALNTVSVFDTMRKGEVAWRALGDPMAPDLFAPVIVGMDRAVVHFADGLFVTPSMTPEDHRPDIVVVPGLGDDVSTSLRLNGGWSEPLRRWAEQGAVVATSCTGAFLAAEAGLLDGRRVATHWVAERDFATRYPTSTVMPGAVVVDEGEVITSGGATTAFNLVHYLVSRFGGAERARAMTRMLLLDSGRQTGLPFAELGIFRDHGDAVVHAAQAALQQRGLAALSVAGLAGHIGVSERTLGRRFRSAIGLSPRDYLTEVRIEAAKRLLEQHLHTVDEIRARVGFSDPSGFRRAFKRLVGESPTAYRGRFAAP